MTSGEGREGYTQGRFRGANMVYGEAEYRFPISKCGGHPADGVVGAECTPRPVQRDTGP
ncbi:MAG: hypothetical protein MZV63_50005 [Marinilabiliales bacterium]|nr:hypothetical protein [Marinilabiliales bacterium]